MAHDVFICHSAKNKSVADTVCHSLEARGIRCWIAPRDVGAGDWAARINASIKASKILVIIFSDHCNASPQILREVTLAEKQKLTVIPFRIEDVQPADAMEYYLSAEHWLDAWTPPMQTHLETLAEKIVSLFPVGHFSAPPAAPLRVSAPPREPVVVVPPKPAVAPNDLALDLGNGVKLELLKIPKGTFWMGSPDSEPVRLESETHHQVTITRVFYMGKHAVTVGQFQRFATATKFRTDAETAGKGYTLVDGSWKEVDGASWRNPGFSQTDGHPVCLVSWNDAKAFCDWVSGTSGKTIELPTEAQWEYACRAGSETPFNFDGKISTAKVNYDGNYVYDGSAKGEYRKKTIPVGSFPPNRWGLYEMHGNVWEWCADWYGHDDAGSVIDPQGPETGSARVLRGGSWFHPPTYCRSAYRLWSSPSNRYSGDGFRCVVLPVD